MRSVPGLDLGPVHAPDHARRNTDSNRAHITIDLLRIPVVPMCHERMKES